MAAQYLHITVITIVAIGITSALTNVVLSDKLITKRISRRHAIRLSDLGCHQQSVLLIQSKNCEGEGFLSESLQRVGSLLEKVSTLLSHSMDSAALTTYGFKSYQQ